MDKTIYENDNVLQVVELMHLINDEKALTNLILKAYKNLYVIPWDKQDEYGKVFQMKQLIAAWAQSLRFRGLKEQHGHNTWNYESV